MSGWMGWKPEDDGMRMTEMWGQEIEREGRAWFVAAMRPLKN